MDTEGELHPRGDNPANTGQYSERQHTPAEVNLSAPTPAPLVKTQRRRRGHAFYPLGQMKKWPKLYATEATGTRDKPFVAHYFAGSIDVYVAEFDPATGEAFGWSDFGAGGGDGYFDLTALEQTTVGSLRQPIERELSFRPGTSAHEVIAKLRDTTGGTP